MAKPAGKTGAMATLPPVTGAAIVVAATMYPVDVVRALVMANPGMGAGAAVGGFVRDHGVMGFVKQGLGAELLNRTFSRIIKFWCQPIAHEMAFGKKQKDGNAFTKGAAGVLATLPEVACIAPFENIKLAEQLDKDKKFNGMGNVAGHLVKTRGVGGLYLGYMGMQFRQGLWTGGFFLSLDVFKAGTSTAFGPGMASDVSSGFLAGVFGTVLNCWTDVTRTAIQKEAVAATFNPKADTVSIGQHFNPAFVIQNANKIIAEKGLFTGLYAGFGVKAIYLGGSGALLAMLVPRFKKAWGCADE